MTYAKIFPAGNVGAPSFIKAVLAPMPWSLLMVTGRGQNLLRKILLPGSDRVCLCGMGSNLFPSEVIKAKLG